MKHARIAALFMLAGCGAGNSTKTIDTPPLDDAVCKAMLESSLDRTCTTPSDCILVESEDCCGPVMLAIHTGTESSFPAKEQQFSACLACPPMGCQHAPFDESGMTAGSGQTIATDCVASKCISAVR